MNQASNTRNEPEETFHTPWLAKILYGILNFAIVVAGVCYAVRIIVVGGFLGGGAFLALLTLFGHLVLLALNRICYEMLIVFFEHLRTTKEMRDLISKEIHALEKGAAAVTIGCDHIIAHMYEEQMRQMERDHLLADLIGISVAAAINGSGSNGSEGGTDPKSDGGTDPSGGIRVVE